MFQTFISRHNSNFFSDKLVLTSVTPASSRSEERFSRNAETDLVCRLLLEKKKLSWRSPRSHAAVERYQRRPSSGTVQVCRWCSFYFAGTAAVAEMMGYD